MVVQEHRVDFLWEKTCTRMKFPLMNKNDYYTLNVQIQIFRNNKFTYDKLSNVRR